MFVMSTPDLCLSLPTYKLIATSDGVVLFINTD